MRKVHRKDKDGFYLEDVIIQNDDKLPFDCVDTPLPSGIYLPARFVNGTWVSTLTEEEIVEKSKITSRPSEIEILKKQQADLIFTLMMNGVI